VPCQASLLLTVDDVRNLHCPANQPPPPFLNLSPRPKNDEPPVETRRLTVYQIFRAAVENAREEIKRSPRTLAFSGLAGGLTMGLSGLGVASVRALIGNGPCQQFVSCFIYPIGFIAVIIGRAQLFTENTLYPVILVLEERRYFPSMLRLWAVVFTANVMGAFLFAYWQSSRQRCGRRSQRSL
jgi:formate/nitrite transporter FocA (FNT family)